jgi:hypothetical protein
MRLTHICREESAHDIVIPPGSLGNALAEPGVAAFPADLLRLVASLGVS